MKKYIFTVIYILAITSGFAQVYNVENDDIYTGKADITATNQVKLTDGFRAVEGSDVHAYIDPSASYTAISPTLETGDTPGPIYPSASINYIRTTVLRQEQTNEANINSSQRIESVDYFDGLGRPVQSVAVQASPGNYDIVTAMEYDKFGRDSIHYLPYEAGTQSGAYASDFKTAGVTFYGGSVSGRESGSSPWNETFYEPSPLNRVDEIRGPDAWQTHPSYVEYLTNSGSVDNWSVSRSVSGSLEYNEDNFSAEELYITHYTDEDNKQTREYKDKLGRVVCKASYDGTDWLETHYIYDDFGLLSCVVPPKASDPDADIELCYYYEYDARHRMIKKDLPGASPVYMVYDNRDRLVLMQDGNLCANGEWQFTKYDALNRPVLTGIIEINKTQEQAAADFENFTGTLYETLSGNIFGYSNGSFPQTYNLLISEDNVYTVAYYDNYNFISNTIYDYTTPHLAGNPTSESDKTKGLLTGTITRVLEIYDEVDDDLLQTVNYYDDYGRIIRTISDNHMNGIDIVYNNYNFANEITENIVRHNVDGSIQDVKLATTYTYDHQGRLLTEKIEIDDNSTPLTLAAYEYNELGEQITKYLHGNSSSENFNQQVDYVYNIKGWIRKQNDLSDLDNDLFAQELKYQDSENSSGYYNGNIWKTDWLNTNDIVKGYTFSYDGINRLETAVYSDGAQNGYYNTAYSYDANGNIHTLSRKSNNIEIDALTYSYLNDGNQLQTVADNGTSAGYPIVSGSYGYDLNGNMTSDPSVGTSLILDYNYLNLPEIVTFDAVDYLMYTYDAAGNKLVKTIILDGNPNAGHFDYCGNFLYEDDNLKAIFTSAGRIVPIDIDGSVHYKFEYNLQDHLGNTRVVFSGHSNGQPEVMQVTDYYPFGMVMNQQNYFASGVLSNKNLYNNKELQDDELGGNSLDWYDYGARFYDPELGRFHTQDAFAEKYFDLSPYQYAGNNPMLNLDFNGDSIMKVTIDDKSGFIKGSSNIYIDHTIYSDVESLLEYAAENEIPIHINSSFRTNKKQAGLTDENSTTPAKSGNSPHNAGLALDFNLYKNDKTSDGIDKGNSTVTKDHDFIKKVKGKSWRWGGDFKDPDKIHMDKRGTDTNFTTIRDANQKQMHGSTEVNINDKYVKRKATLIIKKKDENQ